jgi:hypothetical protein
MSEMNRAYIKSSIDPILEPIVTAIFMQQPADPVQFMLDYMGEHYGKRLSVNANERVELDYLRKEVKALAGQVKASAPKKNESSESEKDYGSDSDDGDSEEGELGELTTYVKPVFKSGDNRARQSVSAEAFGNFNKKEDFKAPFY